MKQIFTLCSAIVLSLTAAYGQSTSENFETVTNISVLENKCWQFTNIGYQPAAANSTIGDSKNLISSNSNSSFTTPYVSLIAGSTISFDYRLTTKLTGSAIKTITVSLLTYGGTSTQIGSQITLDKNTALNTTYSFSATVPVTDIRKIVVSVTSPNNAFDPILFDNVFFGGELNYNGQYNCAAAAATLPIHLKNFQGLLAGEKVQLNWTVADNESGNFFEIQKSNDGKEFTTIAIVSTTQTTGDEAYSYKDETSANTYYRLKLVNKGSLSIYSDVLFIKKQAASANNLNLLQNPVKETLKISFVSENASFTKVVIYNTMGVKISQTSFAATKGSNTIAMTLDGQIKSGTYVLEVSNAASRGVVKFVKD